MPSEEPFDNLRELANADAIQQEFTLEKHIIQDNKAYFALHITR